MAAKKKKTKKRSVRKAAKKKPAKRAAKRRPAKRPTKRRATKRKGPRTVSRGKVGALKVTVQKSGAGFTSKVHSPCGGSMNAGTGATPAQAMQAARKLLGRKSGGSSALARRRLKALCGAG
jgi:hypothetical protein